MSIAALADAVRPAAAIDRAQGSRGGVSLSVAGIAKRFAGRVGVVEALRPIDLEIGAGEFVCVVGPSGCGKSTLLGIIAGLEEPSAGAVLCDGRRVSAAGPDRILLFQEPALFPWLDVQRNVEFGLRQRGVPPRERPEIARRELGRVHLDGFARSYLHQLSGGMRQRVAIARALAMEPRALLMDEPFGALDALTRDRLHAELEEIWLTTRKTIVFVTHNVREAVALGERVVVLSSRPGRILGDFRVDLPRPRSLNDHALADLAADVLAVLQRGMA